MSFDDEDRRSRRHDSRPLTSEQAAAIRALGLKWRDEWRAEVAARAGKANGHTVKASAPRPPRTKSAKAAAAQFAIAVARDAFGRFYWSDTLQGAMKDSLRGGKRHRKLRERR